MSEPWGGRLDDWVIARVARGVPAVIDAEEDRCSGLYCLVCANMLISSEMGKGYWRITIESVAPGCGCSRGVA